MTVELKRSDKVTHWNSPLTLVPSCSNSYRIRSPFARVLYHCREVKQVEKSK